MMPALSGDLLSSTFLENDGAAWFDATPARDRAWFRGLLAWWRRAREALGPASAPRSVLDIGARPLLDLFELRAEQVERHAWGHAARLTYRTEPVATLICPLWGATPAAAWRHAVRSTLVAQVPWAIVFTGTSVVVVDAARPWAKRYLAFDLAAGCRDPRALLIMWNVLSGPALSGGAQSALGRAVAASDAEGLAVCDALGDGVLEALHALMQEIGAARHPNGAGDWSAFEQCLTIVYRLLFLLFAEARDLVPLWHRIYRDSYSVSSLCDRLLDDPGARGTWSTVQAMARLAHAGCHADDLHVTAFNGRLFAPIRTPLGEMGRVRDETAGRALLALGTMATRAGRRRVSFRDLGVEQLGAVYERVLDYEPVRERRTLLLRRTSTERKTTGSFYTPRAMTDFLARRTLAPLVDGRRSDEILALRVLDPAMGSGAFLVAACRYLAERVEQARIAEGAWGDEDITDSDRAQLSRTIAERCLYGIDRNPTAVQLARLSLWLTTLAADRPLTFLDHHLATGNSLIGARLADLPHRPAPVGPSAAGSGQLPLFDDDAREAWGRSVVPDRLRLSLDPSDSPADVKAKERRLEGLLANDARSGLWGRAADLWCGLALEDERVSAGLYSEMQRSLIAEPTALAPGAFRSRIERAINSSRALAAAHWELLFPEAFFDAGGSRRSDAGFDAVIGNPPWEMLRADTGPTETRVTAHDETTAVMRFIRASGQYPLHSSGHVNQYQLFLERILQVLAPGGRFGLILPSGLQSDVGSGGLRRALLDRTDVDTWITFDNRRAIFPIHRSIRYLLLAGTAGGATQAVPVIDGGSDPAILARLPDGARADSTATQVDVPRRFLERWDPAHLTIPWTATPVAMTIAARALELPALSHAAGWGVRFGRELNASDNRNDLARNPGEHLERLPVVEGKHLRPFAIDRTAAAAFIDPSRATALLGERWRRPRVCYRDVASSTNRTTLMAAVLPQGVVSTHTLFCARTPLDDADTWCLTALLNSLAANYLVRLQMTTHVTAALMARLPVPRPLPRTPVHEKLAECARVLSAAESIESAAEDYTAIDATVARLYGLSEQQYEHVLSTFPLLPEWLRARCLERFASAPG